MLFSQKYFTPGFSSPIEFKIAEEMEELKPAELSFQNGDKFFADEHNQWITLEHQLLEQGYSLEEVEQLRQYYKEQYAKVNSKEKAVFKELNLGKAVMKEITSSEDNMIPERETEKEKTTERTKRKQPIR